MKIVNRVAILVRAEGKQDGFLDHDEHGMYSVSEHMPSRMTWDRAEDAVEQINKIVGGAKVVETSGAGTRSPNYDTRRILRLDGDAMIATASLSVVKFVLEEVTDAVTIEGKIQTPTGFTYD